MNMHKKLDATVPRELARTLETSSSNGPLGDSLWHAATPSLNGYRDVSPQQLTPYLGRVRLVDVRNQEETEGPYGRIAEAENIPVSAFLDRAVDWDRDEVLALVCHSGGRSAQAASALTRMGFRRVVNVSGGMVTYNQLGLPVVRGAR